MEKNAGYQQLAVPSPYSEVQRPPQQVSKYGSDISIVAEEERPPPDHLCYSILTCFFCCWPLGLAAVCCSLQARDAYAHGDESEAIWQAKVAQRLALASFICGIIIIIIVAVIIFT